VICGVFEMVKMNPPTVCSGYGYHLAARQVWLGSNALHHAELEREHPCDVTESDWNANWDNFKLANGYSLCLCDLAFKELKREAGRIGLIW